MDAFLVRCSMRAVQRVGHISHLEGVPTSAWQATPCKRVGNTAEGGHNLACQGITFVTQDGVSRLIDTARNISEVVQLLFHILVGRAPPFKKTLSWL